MRITLPTTLALMNLALSPALASQAPPAAPDGMHVGAATTSPAEQVQHHETTWRWDQLNAADHTRAAQPGENVSDAAASMSSKQVVAQAEQTGVDNARLT